MSNPPILSIISPCFKDEQNVPELCRRLTDVCAQLALPYEIILVDDGSPDGTWEVICSMHESDNRICGIRLSRNYGHQMAVSAGLVEARGLRVFILDADLEDPPEILIEMMKAMDEGVENVYGVRISRQGIPVWKTLSYSMFYRILSFLSGCEIPRDSGDFRLISRRIVDYVNAMPEHDRFLRGMISWLGFKARPISYHRGLRHSGSSGYTFLKLMRFAIDGITSFSIIPLRIATLLGLTLSIIWVLGAVYIIVSVLMFGAPIPGWASLMIVILFVSSMQLLILGIFGEYLGRLFIENKRRPLFLVSETTGESPTRTN